MRVMIRVVKKREERIKRGRNGRREEEEGQMRGWVVGVVVVDIAGLIGGWVVGWVLR